MTLQTISVDISPRRIATVTLNRPDRGNAFDQTMLDELGDQLKALAADDDVRIVVLRGAGKHFCTGADLASRGPGAPAQPQPAKYALRDVLAIARRPARSPPSPWSKAARSAAAPGFVTCCDVAIATRAAFFSIPEVRVGMAPMGIMPFMIRAIGHRAFRRYGLSGERIPPRTRCGSASCTRSASRMALDATLAQITDALLLGAPHATSALKAAAARYASPNLAEIIAQRSAAARSEIGGSAGRHRGLPREAQAELVSGVMVLSASCPGVCRNPRATACKRIVDGRDMPGRDDGRDRVDLEESKKKVEALTAPRNAVLVGASDRPGSWAGAGVAQSAQVSIPRSGLSDQSAPRPSLGQALLSRFQVAAGAARSSGRAGAGRPASPKRCAPARRRARAAPPCSRPASARPTTPRPPVLGRELAAVIAETGLAVSGPNCMGNVCAKTRFVTFPEDRMLTVKEGPVAMVGQSGGMMLFANGALERARHRRGISHHQRQRGRPLGRRLHRLLRRPAGAEGDRDLCRGACPTSRRSRRRAAWRAPPASTSSRSSSASRKAAGRRRWRTPARSRDRSRRSMRWRARPAWCAPIRSTTSWR